MGKFRKRMELVSDWWGWRLLGALAMCIFVAAVFYIVYAVHQHSASIGCLTHAVNQALNEAFHKQKLSPPTCGN